jgi:hypothetical protein
MAEDLLISGVGFLKISVLSLAEATRLPTTRELF